MTHVISVCIDEKKADEPMGAPAPIDALPVAVTPAPVAHSSEAPGAPARIVEAVLPQPDAQQPDAPQAAVSEAKDAENAEGAPAPTVAAARAAPAIAAAIVAVSTAKPEPTSKPAVATEKSIGAPVVALHPQKRDIAKPGAASHVWAFAENHGFKAAGVALALGAGWLLGANTFENEAASKRVIASIEALDAKVESVATQAAAREDISTLRASVEKSHSGLDATRNNAAAAVAQLTNKFDRAEREHAARFEKQEKEFAVRLERLTERLDRAERAAASHSPTASISQLPPPAAPAPVTLSARGPRAEETRVPQSGAEARVGADRTRIPANGYVLREVRDGAALVEGRAGLREVIPGDVLPGVGRVRSIERRGKQWVVVTSGGVIDAAGY